MFSTVSFLLAATLAVAAAATVQNTLMARAPAVSANTTAAAATANQKVKQDLVNFLLSNTTVPLVTIEPIVSNATFVQPPSVDDAEFRRHNHKQKNNKEKKDKKANKDEPAAEQKDEKMPRKRPALVNTIVFNNTVDNQHVAYNLSDILTSRRPRPVVNATASTTNTPSTPQPSTTTTTTTPTTTTPTNLMINVTVNATATTNATDIDSKGTAMLRSIYEQLNKYENEARESWRTIEKANPTWISQIQEAQVQFDAYVDKLNGQFNQKVDELAYRTQEGIDAGYRSFQDWGDCAQLCLKEENDAVYFRQSVISNIFNTGWTWIKDVSFQAFDPFVRLGCTGLCVTKLFG